MLAASSASRYYLCIISQVRGGCPLPADSERAQAIVLLARAQQDAVWDRTCAHNKLRSHLREYFPGFLAAFGEARGGIMRPEARRKAAGDRHAAAQRNLFGRLLGCLHHCLATGQPYNEATAFPAPSEEKRSEAA